MPISIIKKLFIAILLFSTKMAMTQTIDDLNKKELKSELLKCQSISDSIANQNSLITIKKQEIERKIEELESELKNTKVSLNTSTLINKEQQIIIANLNDSISSSNRNYQTLLDSIAVLKKQLSNLPAVYTASTNTTVPDFLNRYFQSPFALNNNSFRLSLKGLYIGNADHNNDYNNKSLSYSINPKRYQEYNNDKKSLYDYYLPEIITSEKLSFYSVISKINLNYIDSAEDALTRRDLSYANSLLPKIEILKNKLVTFKYNDSSEENYLFNIKPGLLNNYRRTIQIDLASEEVKNDGSKNSERDIIWKLFVLNNECYLALTLDQLTRIKYPLFNIEDGLACNNPYYKILYLAKTIETAGTMSLWASASISKETKMPL